MQHNVDIDHLKTLENLKQREELADNQNKSKTRNILSNRNADNIDTLPKFKLQYMTSLCRKECSAVFRYKCRMLDVKGNFPGGLENILCWLCSYCVLVLVLVYTQEGSLWSIVLRCDDHTGIFTCDGCARDPYFYVPAETQSYVIKLSCSRKVLAASGD